MKKILVNLEVKSNYYIVVFKCIFSINNIIFNKKNLLKIDTY